MLSLGRFCDLEDIMCKQLLGLDLREQNRLSMAVKPPGFTGQRSNSSFSLSSLCPSSESADNVFPPPGQWRPSPESLLSPQPPSASQCAKAGFQRSLSLVEADSMAAAGLSWPGTDLTQSQCDLSTAGLSWPGTDLSHSQCDLSTAGLSWPGTDLTQSQCDLSTAGLSWPGTDLTQSQCDLSTAGLSSSSLSSSSSSSSRYKTELCRPFTENGLCKYGSKCQFAHGMDEVRDLNRHPKYKTEPCRTFHTIGFCPYGIRCHFVHNNEEERKQSISRSSSFSSSSGGPPQALSSRPNRPPLVRHSLSFAGFPSAPLPAASVSALFRPPSAAPPACTDLTELLSQAILELDSAFEASPAHHPFQASAGEARSPFLPSPDSGCSSPTLRQSPACTRSLSCTSLSDQEQEQDGGSSSSSLSGSEPCCGLNDERGRRLAVFSQLSVPDDPAAFCV